jgi:two-component system, NarL family, response regulator YdfI
MLLITPKERHVLCLLAQQKGTTEIADCLGIGTAAVGTYLTSLFSTMGVSSRTEAIASAFQRGLLVPDTHAGDVPESTRTS